MLLVWLTKPGASTWTSYCPGLSVTVGGRLLKKPSELVVPVSTVAPAWRSVTVAPESTVDGVVRASNVSTRIGALVVLDGGETLLEPPPPCPHPVASAETRRAAANVAKKIGR